MAIKTTFSISIQSRENIAEGSPPPSKAVRAAKMMNPDSSRAVQMPSKGYKADH